MDDELETLQARLSREKVDVVRLWGKRCVAKQLLIPGGLVQVFSKVIVTQ